MILWHSLFLSFLLPFSMRIREEFATWILGVRVTNATSFLRISVFFFPVFPELRRWRVNWHNKYCHIHMRHRRANTLPTWKRKKEKIENNKIEINMSLAPFSLILKSFECLFIGPYERQTRKKFSFWCAEKSFWHLSSPFGRTFLFRLETKAEIFCHKHCGVKRPTRIESKQLRRCRCAEIRLFFSVWIISFCKFVDIFSHQPFHLVTNNVVMLRERKRKRKNGFIFCVENINFHVFVPFELMQ